MTKQLKSLKQGYQNSLNSDETMKVHVVLHMPNVRENKPFNLALEYVFANGLFK